MKKTTQASINSYHATLKAIINYGIKNFIEIESIVNPAQKISIKAPDNERERMLSTDEIIHIFECLIHKPKATLYIAVALGTGARPQAILQVQKKDLDITSGLIRFVALKKGKRYSVPLTDELILMLIDAILLPFLTPPKHF